MDTIYYLYRWNNSGKLNNTNNTGGKNSNNLQEELTPDVEELYCMEEYALQDYRLVRVGIHPKLLRICDENCIAENGKGTGAESVNATGNRSREPGGFFARRRRKKEKRQEREILAQFLQKIHDTPENPEAYSFVCEEPVALFAGLEFNGYFQKDYVRHMMRYGGYTGDLSAGRSARKNEVLSHFVILGQSNGVTEIIYEYVWNMKSLKWILPERQFREEQEALVDILYEEYGLVAELRLLSEEECFAKAHPACRMPSIVLDFSEEDRISTVDVARGSIWLDMGCSEEKRRRIEDRDTGISYFSLKKEWKQPQKAVNYLDTVSKNGYNT